jgi:putative endonuclease
MKHLYFVYMMTNQHHSLFYTGMTNELKTRAWQHKTGKVKGFTSRYNLDKLVWYEDHEWVQDAIAREKQIKRWSRKKKIALIEKMNPNWEDLYNRL